MFVKLLLYILFGLRVLTVAQNMDDVFRRPRVDELMEEEGPNMDNERHEKDNAMPGGEPCHVEDYPFVVGILTYKKRDQLHSYCGGALVTLEWVITAAHCVVTKYIDQKQVLLTAGSTFTNEELAEQFHKTAPQTQVADFGIQHPNYTDQFHSRDGNSENDIGFLRASTPFLNKEPIQLAWFPRFNNMIEQCTTATAVGWGAERDLVNDLRCMKMSIINIKDCWDKYHKYGNIVANTSSVDFSKVPYLCVNYADDFDDCQGDSGGPLVCENMVIGFVRGGSGCMSDKHPAVYTRIDFYTDFILKVLDKEEIQLQDKFGASNNKLVDKNIEQTTSSTEAYKSNTLIYFLFTILIIYLH